jgi:hypothetical protein
MYITNKPIDADLPSTLQLLKSTIVAVFAAMILLIVIVMPAEYGIDPTGIGSATGLQRMGEIKMALAEEAEAEEQALAAELNTPATLAVPVPAVASPAVAAPEAVSPAAAETPAAPQPAQEPGIRSDEMQLALAPGEGREIKVALLQGKTVEYSWQSEGGIANFDVHGDSVPLEIEYHNYSRGAEQTSNGVLEAAFDGNHGWFWRNRTSNPIVVTIQTRGEYTDIFFVE